VTVLAAEERRQLHVLLDRRRRELTPAPARPPRPAARKNRATCAGCGCPGDEATAGCATCAQRHRARRREGIVHVDLARFRTRVVWTRSMVVAAIRRHVAEQGRPPTFDEWAKPKLPGEERPSLKPVYRLFGSLLAAVEAAGFETRPSKSCWS
jgi:hypothetical protein